MNDHLFCETWLLANKQEIEKLKKANEKLRKANEALVVALRWYHCEGQDMALHRRAVPTCGDCALIAQATEGKS